MTSSSSFEGALARLWPSGDARIPGLRAGIIAAAPAQTTGREGDQRLAKATGLDVVANPELVLERRHFLLCGVADFVNCGCLPYAKVDEIVGVARQLNGGSVGLAAPGLRILADAARSLSGLAGGAEAALSC